MMNPRDPLKLAKGDAAIVVRKMGKVEVILPAWDDGCMPYAARVACILATMFQSTNKRFAKVITEKWLELLTAAGQTIYYDFGPGDDETHTE